MCVFLCGFMCLTTVGHLSTHTHTHTHTHTYIYIYIYQASPSATSRNRPESIINWGTVALNSMLSFSMTGCLLYYAYLHMYIYVHLVFANGPGDLGSIPGRVIPKTQKMVLDASLLNTQHYKVRIKGKVEQSREGVAPSPTPWCSSYRKGNLRVTLDYGRQLYFTYLYIYIYIYILYVYCVYVYFKFFSIYICTYK